jgi:uncharacterized protein HemX
MVTIILQTAAVIAATPIPNPSPTDWGSIATKVTSSIASITANPVMSIIAIVVALVGGIGGFALIKSKITAYLDKLAQQKTQAGQDVFIQDQTTQNQQNTVDDNSGRTDLNNTK